MSIHLSASEGEFANTVLMPGDPARAEWIAVNFLTDTHRVNIIRNNFGFTGKYKGKSVSVIASGMGQPTVGIYSTELFCEYGVHNIVRLGTCGAVAPELKLGDCVVGLSGSTDSNITFADTGYYMAPHCSYDLLKKFDSREHAFNVKYGQIFSTDRFYREQKVIPYGNIAVDMETHYLYYIANKLNKHALTVNMVSDIVSTGRTMEFHEKVTKFTDIVTHVLDTVP